MVVVQVLNRWNTYSFDGEKAIVLVRNAAGSSVVCVAGGAGGQPLEMLQLRRRKGHRAGERLLRVSMRSGRSFCSVFSRCKRLRR